MAMIRTKMSDRLCFYTSFYKDLHLVEFDVYYKCSTTVKEVQEAIVRAILDCDDEEVEAACESLLVSTSAMNKDRSHAMSSFLTHEAPNGFLQYELPESIGLINKPRPVKAWPVKASMVKVKTLTGKVLQIPVDLGKFDHTCSVYDFLIDSHIACYVLS